MKTRKNFNKKRASSFQSNKKKVGSHCSILTTRKRLNKLKNQQLFLDPPSKCGHKANCPQNWRDGKAIIVRFTTYQSRNPQAEPPGRAVPGQKNLTCNWQIAGGSEGQPYKLKIPGASPQFCEFYDLECYQVLTVIIGENLLLLLSGTGEK